MNIYNSLSASGSGTASLQGIRGMKVYYDTLVVNFKVRESGSNIYDFVAIEKINFDYDTKSITTDNKGIILNFGNVGVTGAYRSQYDFYVDSYLLEKEKKVLLCGMSAVSADIVTVWGTDSIEGGAYMPVIYEYDINKHEISKVYPSTESEAQEWKSFMTGDKTVNQPVLLSFNHDTKQLNLLLKTNLFRNNTDDIHGFNNFIFDYHRDGITLNNVMQMSADDVDMDYNAASFFKMVSYNREQLVVAQSTNQNLEQVLLPFKLATT